MSRWASKAFVRHAPFVAVLIYIVASTLVFWFGPIPWPVANVTEMVIFQLAALMALVVGYVSGGGAATKEFHLDLRPAFLVGLIGVVALQVPITLTYTGKYPWEVIGAMGDQRVVYEEMLEQLTATQGERFYLPLIRSLVMPLFVVGVGYGLMNFNSLGRLQKTLLLVGLMCPVNLSLLRGTDKEIADLIIIILGFLLVAYCRNFLRSDFVARRPTSLGARRFKVMAFVAIVLFFFFFSYRKYQRLDGIIDFCVMDGGICADYSGPILSLLPDFIAFGLAMISAYLTNGYYGLSLALDLPFESALGIGHSSALLSLYERLSGSSVLWDKTYIARISDMGWDHRYYWASLYTWLANDVHFFGALVVVGYLARWFRQAWRDAIYSHNDSAAVVFVLICIAFVYLPANNQIGQTFDLYFSFVGAFMLWKLGRATKRRARKFGLSRSSISS